MTTEMPVRLQTPAMPRALVSPVARPTAMTEIHAPPIAATRWTDVLRKTIRACDDGEACTDGDTCDQGACVPGPSVCECQNDGDCPTDTNLCDGSLFCDVDGLYGPANSCVNDPNTVVSCTDIVPADPPPVPRWFVRRFRELARSPLTGQPCDDGDACTFSTACNDSSCSGQQTLCDDGNPCTDDTCDSTTGCLYTQYRSDCDDGSACTESDACADGSCEGITLNCDDGNDCTADSCDTATGCINDALDGAACDDGDACTSGDTCSGLFLCGRRQRSM